MRLLCVHETVAHCFSCNLATFDYHCKIYQFQFSCVPTSLYWIQVYFRSVIFLLLRAVLACLKFAPTPLW